MREEAFEKNEICDSQLELTFCVLDKLFHEHEVPQESIIDSFNSFFSRSCLKIFPHNPQNVEVFVLKILFKNLSITFSYCQ